MHLVLIYLLFHLVDILSSGLNFLSQIKSEKILLASFVFLRNSEFRIMYQMIKSWCEKVLTGSVISKHHFITQNEV